MDLSLLDNLKVSKPVVTRNVGYNKECTTGDFIITKAGSIIFSDKFREELTIRENELKFLDMVDGRDMKFEDGIPRPFLFVGILPKGAKTASIQGFEGKMSFVKNKLIPLLTDLYKIDWEQSKQQEFVLLRDRKVEPFNNIHYMPRINKKKILKYVRRENIEVYPCIPVNVESSAPTSKSDTIELDLS